jgi:tRNA (5-methylaminomethyl-2-thiouridylate)-methyltransferase
MSKIKSCAVLVSGGVDSSVALTVLKHQGFNLKAFYLKIWLEDELSYLSNCPWEEDLSYAQKVCDQLSVPLEILSFQQAYFDHVVTYTVSEIKKGLTPNPDMFCNRAIKLGAFLDQKGHEFDYIATGHYALNIYDAINDKSLLFRARDEFKDQTYFLAYTPQERLKKVLFPLGEFENKNAVRQYAKKYNLATAERPDSQGICFLGKIAFKDFVAHYCGKHKGDLIEYETQKKIGEHEGFWFYTHGQRQGIGLAEGPWYVVEKNPEKNIVYISRNYFDFKKERNQCYIDIKTFNWLSNPLNSTQKVWVKIRHGQDLKEALFSIKENNLYHLVFSLQDQGIAPGQFAVLYNENRQCLGGGIIQRM